MTRGTAEESFLGKDVLEHSRTDHMRPLPATGLWEGALPICLQITSPLLHTVAGLCSLPKGTGTTSMGVGGFEH